MNFSDIFKKSFLEGYTSADISTENILICLIIASVIGFYIYMIYRNVTKKTFYDNNFAITIAILSVITAGIVMTIQSNLVVSLGMVGALSIIRFRTAIKDPMDLLFMFWSISAGIICGAGLASIAIILSVVITVWIFILQRIPQVRLSMILVVNATDINCEKSILDVVYMYSKHCKIKSRNLCSNSLNIVIEVMTKDESDLVKEIMKIQNVSSASLISHNGESSF